MNGSELGFKPGNVVQEFLYDEDVDFDFRQAIETATGQELVGEDAPDLCDGAIIWWRADDADAEDLDDVLVEVISNLENGGTIWVLTPKPGAGDHVSTQDISEACETAGLHPGGVKVLGSRWTGIPIEARPRS